MRYLAALSHVLTLAVEWDWLSANPVRNVRKPRQPQGRVRYLSSEELPRLLAACDLSTSSALATVVLIALATGMRRGEITGLRWSDVDLEQGVLRLHDTKNGERRQIPLLGRALDVLRQQTDHPHQPNGYVFPGEIAGRPCDITKAWTTAVTKAGLVDFHFHDVRHDGLVPGYARCILARDWCRARAKIHADDQALLPLAFRSHTRRSWQDGDRSTSVVASRHYTGHESGLPRLGASCGKVGHWPAAEMPESCTGTAGRRARRRSADHSIRRRR